MYLKDIIVFSKKAEEHINHVVNLLAVPEKAVLYLKIDKWWLIHFENGIRQFSWFKIIVSSFSSEKRDYLQILHVVWNF